MPVRTGVLVASLVPVGLAAQGGLAPDDVILGMNDTVIRNTGDLLRFLRACSVGETVTVTVYRGGQAQDFQVTLAEMPST